MPASNAAKTQKQHMTEGRFKSQDNFLYFNCQTEASTHECTKHKDLRLRRRTHVQINDTQGFTWPSSWFHHLGPALRDPGETHISMPY